MNEQNGINNVNQTNNTNNLDNNMTQGVNLNNGQIIQPIQNQPVTLGQVVNTSPSEPIVNQSNPVPTYQNPVPMQNVPNQMAPNMMEQPVAQNNFSIPTTDNQMQNMSNQVANMNQPINNQPQNSTNQIVPNNMATPPMEQPQEQTDNTTKKKNPILLIVLIVVIILLAGGAACYYFILDNPQKIFTTAANQILQKANNINIGDKKTIDYNLSINASSEDENIQTVLNIINEIKLKGTYSGDTNNNTMSGVINYKDGELLDYSVQTDGKILYTKLNNIYDKVIKIDTTSENEVEEIPQYSTDINDYKQIISSTSEAIKSVLNNANYKKENTKLDNQKVKKITLVIDEKFLTDFYDLLLQDNNFLTSYSKIMNEEESKIREMLNEAKTDASGNNEEVSLYLTNMKNELKRFEYIGGDYGLTIDINDNQYDFSIYESSVSKYVGYIKLSSLSNQQMLSTSINMVEEKINLNINTIYSIDENKEIELFDTTDAIDYQDLSEEDMNSITTKLYENKTLLTLIEDLGLEDTESLALSSDI